MSDDNTNTAIDAGESQSVTETENHETDTISVDNGATPSVEIREGKTFIDGNRVFTKAEKDAIAKVASRETEAQILRELGVDSLQSVKQVVRQLQTANIDSEGEASLDISALKNAVAKKEQTVAELKAELEAVKSQYVLDNHIGKLKSNMPNNWTESQKESVVKLMRADNMLRVEGQSFHIVDNEDFLTLDDGTPDYNNAVRTVGNRLGLPFSKSGVATVDAQSKPVDNRDVSTKAINEERLKTDNRYRDAYVALRRTKMNLDRSQITNKMIEDQMARSQVGSFGTRQLGVPKR